MPVPTVFVGKFTDDWPVQQAMVVGRIVIAFSQLEWALYLTPKRLRGVKMVEYRKWPDDFTVHRRCNQVSAECALVLADPLLGQVRSLIASIRAVNTERNKIIHGTWMARPSGERIVIKNERGVPVSREHLEDLLDRIRRRRDDLNSVRWPKLDAEQRAKLPDRPSGRDYRDAPS